MLDRLITLILWTAGLVVLFLGLNLTDPYLSLVRGWISIALLAAILTAIVILMLRGHWGRRGLSGKLLILLWCSALLAMAAAQSIFEMRKFTILHSDDARLQKLGRHFI